MTTQQGLNKTLDQDKLVEKYLKTHPDFFQRNTALLTHMRIPHDSGNAVSLIEYQIDSLRGQIKKLERDLGNLIGVARDNDRLNERMHRLALALMETHRIDDVFLALQDSLRNDFFADVITLRILPENPIKDDAFHDLEAQGDFATRIILAPDEVETVLLGKLLNLPKPSCDKQEHEQLEALFGDKVDSIASTAIIPLSGYGFRGLLAVASSDPERYHGGMGTVFLSYIGSLISVALQPYMEGSQNG